jgi:hypothetical protein
MVDTVLAELDVESLAIDEATAADKKLAEVAEITELDEAVIDVAGAIDDVADPRLELNVVDDDEEKVAVVMSEEFDVGTSTASCSASDSA